MAKKSLKKDILERAEILIEDEATDAITLYDVKYVFHDYDADVQTFYMFEDTDSPNSVEHYMMESLQEKLQEIDPRYRVGIMFRERDASSGADQ